MKKMSFLTSLIAAAILSTFNIVSAAERQIVNEGEALNISDLTLENINYDGNGGAVENYGTLDVNNSIFNENSSYNGGAIYNKGTINSVNASIFNGNKAFATQLRTVNMKEGWNYDTQTGILTGTLDGETVEVTAAPVYKDGNYNILYNGEIVGTVYTNGNGGAIHNAQGSLVINDSNFSNNTSLIEHKTFNNNSYDDNGILVSQNAEYVSYEGSGGAIYTRDNLDITDSIFENNKAAYGGAIYSENADSITNIKNSKFINNTSYNENSEKGSLTVGEEIYNFDNEHYGLGSGGAVVTNGETNIENSKFTGNTTGGDGGAVSVNGDLNVKNSIFKNNIAKADNKGTQYNYKGNGEVEKIDYDYHDGYGGAISHGSGNLVIENSIFENNIAGGEGGGAISSEGSSINIASSVFTGNSSSGNGGAVYSKGKMVVNDSKFDNNSALNGGALNVVGDLEVENAEFTGNSASETGGAIFNVGTDIYIKNSTFKNNIAKSEVNNGEEGEVEPGRIAGAGGAIFAYGDDYYGIYNTEDNENPDTNKENKFVIENSTFENNISGDDGGGAIATSTSSEIKDSVFKNNQTSGNGGAISANPGVVEAVHTSSNFALNNSDSNLPVLGAVMSIQTLNNSSFENNSAFDKGGAIYANNSGLVLTDTDFINNSANTGGAIYAGWTGELKDLVPVFEDLDLHAGVHVTALNKDVKFNGNQAENGADIYLENNILYLNSNEGKKITFDGGITGKNSIININDKTKNLYEDLSSTGQIVINNFVTPEKESTLPVNLKGGIIKLTQEKYLDGTDLTLEEGSTLDLTNNKTGTMTLNSLTSNNGNLNMDMDLSGKEQNFDFINAKTASGNLNISGINVLSDMEDNVNEISVYISQIGLPDTIALNTSGNEINTLTNDYLYTVTSDGKKIEVNRLTDDAGNAKVIDGFTTAVNQNDIIDGHEINLSDNRVYSANKDIEITAQGSSRGWTGELGGKSLTVNGMGRSLNGYDKKGIVISNNQTLTFNDTNINGFKTFQDRKGALTVKDGGQLNINAVNHNVTIGGVSADKNMDTNAIYLDGSSSKAFLSTSNLKEITVNNDIRSSNISNELKLNGDGKITFNGIVDPLTLTNENSETFHNNFIDGVNYNLNSGTVSFAKDEYLNGQTNKNTLNFNGGTLNLANGSVGLIDLAALNINANSNIMLDADLAAEKMDKITADSASANTDAFLNVSNINLLSDAIKDKVEINAIEAAVTLDNGETLASHITTSVGNVAYSPIFKYGVDYNPSTGNFTFSRPSTSDYRNLNPAVMVAPAAAQAGGYMTMLDTYSNAFANMDMRMLSPSSMRLSSKNANKYAVTELSASQNTYQATEYNSGGIYVKPYASFDSVGMKNGPKVNNMSYGSFIGGDSAVHQFQNGFEGTFSPYIAYQGSHQNFAGNSIYQNGGTLGFTGSLYKGKFFTGLTAGIGVNLSEASTMFGNEDFPMLMTGVANKTGYNFEFKDGKFIIQPSLMLSYSFVNTFNYKNAAGVRIDADPLHAFQIAPAVKFVFNTESGWQPYASVGMMWNLMDDTQFTANNVSLPDLSIKPYFQYGLGVQKLIGDRFTAYGQVMLRNGGRNGIAATFGGKYMLGHESRLKENI